MHFFTGAGTILSPGGLISWLLVGLIAGFFASRIMRGRGYGCLGNTIVGLIGAVIGGFLASWLNLGGQYHFWGSVLIAFLGACLLVLILQAISGNDSRRSY